MSKFASEKCKKQAIEAKVDALPCPILQLCPSEERGGALISAEGALPDNIDAAFAQWVDRALWMLENSGVPVRHLPTGKYVALAYNGGHVVISEDLFDELSDDMHRACTVTTYETLGLSRERTCVIFTRTPFLLSVNVYTGEVFLKTDAKADVVVYSPERIAQIWT